MTPENTETSDRLTYATAVEFHQEIARLHGVTDRLRAEIERLRLTDAERYAVTAGLRSLERALWADPENLGGEYRDIQRDAATLRGLLERCSKFAKRESDRPQPIATPNPQSTPAECSVATERT